MAGRKIRENKEEIGTCIQKIGQTALKAAPKDWEKIVLSFFDFNSERSEVVTFYVYRTSEREYVDWGAAAYEMEDDELDNLLCDLREYFVTLHGICSKAHDDWRMAVMSIDKDGSFNMKYSYDPIPQYDRRFVQKWEAEYLF